MRLPDENALGGRPAPRGSQAVVPINASIESAAEANAAGNVAQSANVAFSRFEDIGARIQSRRDTVARVRDFGRFEQESIAELQRVMSEEDMTNPETLAGYNQFLIQKRQEVLAGHEGSRDSMAQLEARTEAARIDRITRAGGLAAEAQDERVEMEVGSIRERAAKMAFERPEKALDAILMAKDELAELAGARTANQEKNDLESLNAAVGMMSVESLLSKGDLASAEETMDLPGMADAIPVQARAKYKMSIRAERDRRRTAALANRSPRQKAMDRAIEFNIEPTEDNLRMLAGIDPRMYKTPGMVAAEKVTESWLLAQRIVAQRKAATDGGVPTVDEIREEWEKGNPGGAEKDPEAVGIARAIEDHAYNQERWDRPFIEKGEVPPAAPASYLRTGKEVSEFESRYGGTAWGIAVTRAENGFDDLKKGTIPDDELGNYARQVQIAFGTPHAIGKNAVGDDIMATTPVSVDEWNTFVDYGISVEGMTIGNRNTYEEMAMIAAAKRGEVTPPITRLGDIGDRALPGEPGGEVVTQTKPPKPEGVAVPEIDWTGGPDLVPVDAPKTGKDLIAENRAEVKTGKMDDEHLARLKALKDNLFPPGQTLSSLTQYTRGVGPAIRSWISTSPIWGAVAQYPEDVQAQMVVQPFMKEVWFMLQNNLKSSAEREDLEERFNLIAKAWSNPDAARTEIDAFADALSFKKGLAELTMDTKTTTKDGKVISVTKEERQRASIFANFLEFAIPMFGARPKYGTSAEEQVRFETDKASEKVKPGEEVRFEELLPDGGFKIHYLVVDE